MKHNDAKRADLQSYDTALDGTMLTAGGFHNLYL